MRTFSTAVRGAALALAGLLGACSSTPTTSQGTSTTSSGASGGTVIKIGVDLPESGGDASNGIPTRNGALIAIDEANAKAPAGFTFALYDLDDAVQGIHDPAQGAQNVKSFVSDASTLAMMGPFNSNVAKAEIPITNDAGLAQISPSNTNVTLTGPGTDAKALRPSHPDVNAYFRVCTRDDKQGAAGAQFAKKLGFKSVFIIDDNETYGKGLADVFDDQFRKGGGTVLGHEHLTKGQTDYKALLTKAAALKPDVVFYGGTTVGGGGLLRKQMGDVGMGSIPYIGGDGISDAEFLKTAGTMADNSYYTVAAPEASKLASAKDFVAAYQKKFPGQALGPYSANAYTAVSIEIAAIEKAIVADKNQMPTRAEVLANVAATKGFKSPIGTVGFDAYGDTTAPILSLYKITGGKAQYVDQINLST